ncbi:alanine/glycine:cation symporter family protein [Streptococcus salivarius]|uniref:alanine/glycine:cation symporter family protein n=1 Tax=Streptococcus salivarius TaxID=1304 RepID=UPI00398C6FE5
MLDFFTTIDDFVWGPPLLVLLVGTGIYLTIRLGLLQVLRLPKAFKLIFAEDKGEGDISSFAALATALAATVGTGNIVGVATAIKTGGPGALFWMWIAAFFGMATKYSEGLLAIKFRTLDDQGNVSGGPMYYITHGFSGKWQTIAKPLAYFFAFAGVLVAWLGIGTFSQVNSITASLQNSFDWSPKIVSVILALITAAIIFGGIQSISKVSEKVVPFMAGLYILAALVVIFTNFNQLLPVLGMVFQSAFTGKAAVGGFAGATVMVAMRLGIARGVFSNESGLGSAPIAVVLFAFTTILGWSYYGERCFEFIFKSTKFLPLYRLIFVVMVALGGYLTLDVVWKIADIVNGLMALPNLIALLVLSPIIFKETKSYFERHK